MRLDGIHHITAITADAARNLDFYTRVMGLRLVKKTVNQDDPTVYHLFYADELGSPGADLTFFEYPGARRGRPGAGMVHRIVWRVASPEAIDFWRERLVARGVPAETTAEGGLLFADPEGLDLELIPVNDGNPPLRAESPEIPPEHALLGFAGVRAFATDPEENRSLLTEFLGFAPAGDGRCVAEGDHRRAFYAQDRATERGLGGAGTVHHVAWASPPAEHPQWLARLAAAGARPTPIIDRFYFRSIYFREPSGVLFEIATIGPGFTADEPLATLGEHLSLPPDFEPLRAQVESVLTPLPVTRRHISLT